MQRCFVEDSPLASPEGRALIAPINGLIRARRDAGVLVVHTRAWMKKDRSDLGVMGELVPPFIVDLYTEHQDSAELHDALDVVPDDVILNKTRYGAFHATDLAQQLHRRGIDTVVISGIATNICCETTAREAAQHDFRVVFLSDGTATKEMNGVPAEELPRATLASIGVVFGHVATIEQVVEKLQEHEVQRATKPAKVPLSWPAEPRRSGQPTAAGGAGVTAPDRLAPSLLGAVPFGAVSVGI